ncbi:MAG: 2-C-methyl-D-erythritol 4-phosphate cytidylyltransferase [Salibacteraceae bacterium]|nr:2-C-methyl-D-erythritol 4-phosphate cytidylyltransferase [Salibacteraceae bacterium]|tara:strand:+ start:3156 stop:3839 length:684 start_codon:yes stop_codon:yes gene_type:complete
MKSKKFAIIVAGGSGSRMQSETPKQFLPLGEKTIIEHTIQKFLDHDAELQLVVVIPEAHLDLWKSLSKKITKNERLTQAFGGATRYHSVSNGLKCIEANEGDLVAIHDAVRPLFSNDLIERCFVAASQDGNAIPATALVETIRKLVPAAKSSEWVDRGEYRAIQTPQTFQYDILKDAYNQLFSDTFTDDASVVEAMGVKVNLVEGERNNIKITTQEDLKLARLLILS